MNNEITEIDTLLALPKEELEKIFSQFSLEEIENLMEKIEEVNING